MSSLFRLSSTRAIFLALGVTASAVTSTMITAPVSAQSTPTTPGPASPLDQNTPPTTPGPTSSPDQGTPSTTPGPTSPSDQGTPPTTPGNVSPPEQITPPTSTPAPSTGAAATFSDVAQDYWASAFIQALAARNVIAGFPDGSFRPDRPVTRAEFAAMIQKAFNQNQVRQLPSGGFSDVPSSYWAASAIQNAYETGFMSGYPGNVFRPNQQIPKVEAIVALTSGLGLNTGSASSDTLTTYYTDASAIPNYAVSNVATATQGNLVVNYPDVKALNPLRALTRAEAAAHLYQALVRQGKLQPLASNVAAAQYIVGGPGTGTATGSTQTGNDIVSLVASSNSLTTLTSLLKTAGVADALQQQGPFTVFAPTDQAFAALPKGTVERLQLPENKELLVKILSYHVLPTQVNANQLSSGEQKTVEGAPVNIRIASGNNQIRVNKAKVLQSNVQASNGVIYAIDSVLLPPDFKVSQLQGGGNTNGGTNDGTTAARATRGGRSYIGVGGNIGLGGNSALGDGNFAVITKLGLTRNFSLRPSAVIGDSPVVLVPITYDLAPRSLPIGQFSIAPYLGAGVAIDTGNGTDVGFLLSGGVDVPLGSRFTLNGSVNAAFLNDTDVGLMLGVGYNFR